MKVAINSKTKKNQFSSAVESEPETALRIIGCSRHINRLSLLISLIACSGGIFGLQSNSCHAADFSRAKKIIVPPSAIERHQDHHVNSNFNPSLNPVYGSPYSFASPSDVNILDANGTANKSPQGKISPTTNNGLVPPPPPIAPSILPPALLSPTLSTTLDAELFAGSQPPAGNTPINRSHQQITDSPRSRDRHTQHTSNSQINKTGSDSARIANASAHADRLLKEGRLQEAQTILERYYGWYPESPELHAKLAQASEARAKYYLRQDDYVEAANQARLALYFSPESKESRSLLLQALHHQGIEQANQGKRLDIASDLLAKGRLKEARVEYREVNAISQNSRAYLGLGNVDFKEGDLEAAKGAYHKALELASHNSERAEAHRQMGALKYVQNDLIGANADLSQALVLNSGDQTAGKILRDLWQRQVQMRPEDPNTHLGLARAYQLAGDLQSAQSEYKTVVKLAPDHPNLPAARESFKQALAFQEASVAHQAAKTLELNGAINDAFNKASEAADLAPNSPSFRFHQAQLAEKLGYNAQARSLYMMVLQQEPGNNQAAERIKLLSNNNGANQWTGEQFSQQANHQSGMHATAGSLSSIPANNYFTIPSQSAAMLEGEGPPLPYLPTYNGMQAPVPGSTTALAAGTLGPLAAYRGTNPSHDPLTNMTNFLSSLRNHMLDQENYLKSDEDEMMVKLGKAKPKRSSSLLAATDNSSTSGKTSSPFTNSLPSPEPFDTGKLISSTDVAKVLEDARNVTLSASSAASPPVPGSAAITANSLTIDNLPTDTENSRTAALKPEIIDNHGIRPDEEITKAAYPNAVSFDGSSPRSITDLESLRASAPAIIQQISNDPRVGEFAKQTAASLAPAQEALKNKLSTMSTADMDSLYNKVREPLASGLGLQTAPPIASQNTSAAIPAVAPDRKAVAANEPLTESELDEQKSLSRMKLLEDQNKSLMEELARTKEALQSRATQDPNLLATSSTKAVPKPFSGTAPSTDIMKLNAPLRGPRARMELLGMEAKNGSLTLNVSLRNETTELIKIPKSTKAILRKAGDQDRLAEVKFQRNKLSPGETMKGNIIVKGEKLDPSVSVLIPELGPANGSDRDIHLTVPTSILTSKLH